MCFSDLVVGSGGGSFASLTSSRLLLKFRDFVIDRLRLPEPSPKIDSSICLFKKNGQRTIKNFEQVHRRLEDEFERVTVMENVENRSLRSEIASIRDCDVFITPPGGSSLTATFLHNDTALILLDYYDLWEGRSRQFAGEGRMWSHASWIERYRYSYGLEDVEVNCTGAEVFWTDGANWRMRKCGNVVVREDKMARLVARAAQEIRMRRSRVGR